MTRLRTIELDAGTSVLIGSARMTLLENWARLTKCWTPGRRHPWRSRTWFRWRMKPGARRA